MLDWQCGTVDVIYPNHYGNCDKTLSMPRLQSADSLMQMQMSDSVIRIIGSEKQKGKEKRKEKK